MTESVAKANVDAVLSNMAKQALRYASFPKPNIRYSQTIIIVWYSESMRS